MKLFIYNEKDETVNGEIDLGTISITEVALLEKVFEWLGYKGITNSYHDLVLADNFHQTYEDGESIIVFK